MYTTYQKSSSDGGLLLFLLCKGIGLRDIK